MHSRARPLLLALPLFFLLLVLVAPTLRLLGEAGALAWWEPWADPYLRGRITWTFVQATLTCLFALVLGLPLAWVLARWEFAGRVLLLRTLMLPFVVPTLVAAMGVLAIWGPQGLAVGWGGPNLQGSPWLLLYGNLFFNLCLVVRAATEALEHVSASRLAAARTLGASPWRAFWRVEWPAIAPWLMSAQCLVFLYCFSGFGMALVLGGHEYATVEVEIYTLVAHELQLASAAVLAMWMLLLTGLVALMYAAIEHRLANAVRADTVPRRRPSGVWQGVALAGALMVWAFFCAAPLLAIIWRAGLADPVAWLVLLDASTWEAVWNTVRFSALAVVCATVLGVAHAMAARQSVLVRALAFLPFVVSPVAVAFGLLLLYPQWTASMGLLVAAYTLLAYPFVAKSVAAGLDSVPPNLLLAARTLGATPWRVFWCVTLPLLRPALLRGMAFAAATAVGEFAVTLFLSRPEWATVTTLIYERLGRPGGTNHDAAMVLACLLMALALLVFVLIENWATARFVPASRHGGPRKAGPAAEYLHA